MLTRFASLDRATSRSCRDFLEARGRTAQILMTILSQEPLLLTITNSSASDVSLFVDARRICACALGYGEDFEPAILIDKGCAWGVIGLLIPTHDSVVVVDRRECCVIEVFEALEIDPLEFAVAVHKTVDVWERLLIINEGADNDGLVVDCCQTREVRTWVGDVLILPVL